MGWGCPQTTRSDKTHYLPNGWGWKGRVVNVDGPKSAERLGTKPGYTAPPAG